MHIPKWALFFDFHTMPANPDVGKAFNMEAITDWIKECGADFIVFPETSFVCYSESLFIRFFGHGSTCLN